MRKGLKISLWSLGTVVVLLVGLVTIGPTIFMRMVAPNHEFGSRALPPAPDYAQRSNWSAWPDDESPAERLPVGVSQIPQAERLADAFFLHPTSYGGKESWVQPMDDEDARQSTDQFSISRQASAFNACCRVYAPRYRQSNIMGYQEERYDEIFDIGYQDARAAFRHFLSEIDADSPIVLGSHSQGSFQMARLIAEEIDGTPLMERLVAAYVVGHQLSNALIDDVYQDIELCRTATQTGCLISWDAHEADKTPSGMADGDGQKNWNGTDYSGFDAAQNICVNPISWTTGSAPSAKTDDLGALAMVDKGSEPGGSLGELVSGTVSAHCENGEHSNWLFVNADRSPKLQAQGIWSYFGRNLHGSDYGLFWANIRQNAVDRSHAFIEAREVPDSVATELSVSAVAAQREYHFDYVNGADENDGTKAKPWKTLSKLDGLSLNPGDKVLFAKDASFHGGVTIMSSGTKEAPIVITSYRDEGHMPKFTNSDPRHLNGNVLLIKGSHIVVDGLYFHNGPAAAEGLGSAQKMGAVFIDQGAEHIIIRNCEVYDYPAGFQSHGTHVLISKNYLHDSTGFLEYPHWGPVGIMVAASHHEISYNRIENYKATGGTWGSDGGAIEVDSHDDEFRENIEIHHNISVGNQGFLELTKGPGRGDPQNVHVHHNVSDDWQQFILLWGGRDLLIEHNTVLSRKPKNSNIHVVFALPKGSLENVRIRNNVFAVAHGLQVFAGASPYSESDYDQPRDHNLYYSLDGSVEDPSGLPLGTGGAVGDPLFVDLEGMDLRLRAGSPAIDTATDSGLPVDLVGKPRISGKAPDKGAFEFGVQEN